MSKNEPIEHEIVTSEDEIFKVWIKQLSFMDYVKASGMLVKPGPTGMKMDVEGYYRYALITWVVKTEPELDDGEILLLNSDIGAQLCALFPQTNDVLRMVNGGFTKPSRKD